MQRLMKIQRLNFRTDRTLKLQRAGHLVVSIFYGTLLANESSRHILI